MNGNRRQQYCCATLIAAVIGCCGPSLADPPKVDYLVPAGTSPTQSRTIKATGSFDRWPVDVWIDRQGLQVSASKEKGIFKVEAEHDAQGVYYLRFHDQDGASSVRPFIVDPVPSVDEIEPNNELDTAQLITSPAVIDATLHKSGEVDVFAIELQENQTLIASVTANWVLGSPMDSVLQVVDERGFVIEQNDDNVGTDSRAAFTAPQNGTYYVRVFAFPSTPNSTIAYAGGNAYVYRLTMTTGPFVEYTLPLARSANDGDEYQIHGWNIPSASTALEHGHVVHPRIASALSLEQYPAALVQSDETTSVAAPVSISGCIEQPGQVHRFQLKAKKGQSLRFRVESDTLGYRLDPVIKLMDHEGKVIGEVDDSSGIRDCQLIQKIPSDGQYTLQLQDLYRDGGMRYAYRLTIDESSPGYALTVAGDSFVVKSGDKVAIPVSIARERGFNEEIEISVTGLPDFATAAVVKSEPKGDSAKSVTLHIQCKAGSFSGPIAIIGKTSDQNVGERQATFQVAGTLSQLSDIWLTTTQ